jgi:glycosyltransferase involved in cell wall biosynthesis
MRRRVFFNGKFYSAQLNGVHRVADRLIREVDAALTADAGLRERLDVRLLAPERRSWSPEFEAIRIDVQRRGHTQLWEQALAPWEARGGLLVNLCNLSPILHFNKITLIHDAQFFLYPESYPLRFSLGYRLLTPLMARTSRQVLTISDFSRQMLDRFGVSARDRTRVIKNGVDHILEQPPDLSALERLGLADGGYVLMFGSPMAYKNVAVVFEAMRRPEMQGLKLAVVGADRASLEQAGLEPPPGAVFVGRVDDGLLRALYERALCLAYPSLTEGFGLPPMEAMLCGCPAVAAPEGAIPEICGEAATYVDARDARAWADAVLALHGDAPARARKVAEGRQRAGTYTWRRAGAELLEMILATGPA